MTRERVINRVKTAFEMWEDEWCVGDWSEEYEARDIAVAVLEKYQWTPTSKKLPEINQPVLVWTSGDYWLAELHLLDDVLYWDFDTFDLSGEDFNDVVAWMPLPEPFKEDET